MSDDEKVLTLKVKHTTVTEFEVKYPEAYKHDDGTSMTILQALAVEKEQRGETIAVQLDTGEAQIRTDVSVVDEDGRVVFREYDL